jgi:hypothetical protein
MRIGQRTPLAATVVVCSAGVIGTPETANADFISGFKANLEVRNWDFNRDFRQEGGGLASGQIKVESGLHVTC